MASTTDTDFTTDRLVDRAKDDLANGLGNAVNRIATLRHRHQSITNIRTDRGPPVDITDLPATVARALGDLDRRAATTHISDAIDTLNRDIETRAPWQLARQPERADELAKLLGSYVGTLRSIADANRLITPDLADLIDTQLDLDSSTSPSPVFQRLEAVTGRSSDEQPAR